jgi:hypothetical protein
MGTSILRSDVDRLSIAQSAYALGMLLILPVASTSADWLKNATDTTTATATTAAATAANSERTTGLRGKQRAVQPLTR